MRLCRTYYDLWQDFIPSGKRIAINQGGTRSGKTYSILQFLIEVALLTARHKLEPRMITICRKTLPALRATAMRDFFQLLEGLELYNEGNHNKSNFEYNLEGTVFEFISIDDPQKVRGRKRDILFINEANELSLEEYRQLSMRTLDKVILDFNPSDEFSFIYDEVIPRQDAAFYKTTYLDNPFLSATLVREIELLREADPNYWRIYGEGERGISTTTVFPDIHVVKELPEGLPFCYGMDFGFTAPTTLVKVASDGKALYWHLELYKTNLTTTELVQELRRILAPNPRATIYPDPSRPETIRELELAGFKIGKTRNEIYEGIQSIKRHRFHVTESSVELLKELRGYKWKTGRDGRNLDEPIGLNDHAIDAGRYGTYSNQKANISPARFNFR